MSKHELVVQNLSLQTDSTDLLGGYRPLEIRHIARTVYTEFVQLFVSSFSKSQNAQFLDYVTEAYEKGNWKRLSQCFIRASKMGLEKMKQLKKKNKNRLSTTAHTGLTGVTGFFTASTGNANNRSRISKISGKDSLRSLGRMDNSSGGEGGGTVNRKSNPDKYGIV